MNRTRIVPLAWLNLTHNGVRMALFCAGIGFAVVLMFIQDGCRNALLDSSVLLLDRMNADIVVVGSQQTTVLLRSPVRREVLQRARAVREVREVHPLYLEYTTSLFRNAAPDVENRKPSEPIRVIGVDLAAHLLTLPELDPANPNNRTAELGRPGNALFDRLSQPVRGEQKTVYGPVGVGTTTELSGQTIHVVGTFELGMDFGCSGSLIVSNETFAQTLRPGGLDQVDVGLIRLVPGADPSRVRDELGRLLEGSGVLVLTKGQFRELEMKFWRENTPIGAVFGFGMFMGFLVGMVICYQILSSDIRDNLSAYATLRAIGYPNSFLRNVVLQESLLLAAFGFVPGLLVSWGTYELLAWLTALPMNLTFWRVFRILFITVVMCVVSGLLAVRQAQQADPAEVF